MQVFRATRPVRLAVQRLVAVECCAAARNVKLRSITTAKPSPAVSETTYGLLQFIQDGGSSTKDASAESETQEGRVLSTTGPLVRLLLPGPVAVGQAVDIGGMLGIILHYDSRCAVAAVVTGEFPRNGDIVRIRSPRLSVRKMDFCSQAGSVEFFSILDLLDIDGTGGVLQLPMMPPPQRRRPVSRHVPSGLAAVDTMMPLGEGHRVCFVGPQGTGKSTAVRMLMRSQKEDTVCVYASQMPLPKLQKQFKDFTATGAALTIVHSGSTSPCAQYFVPLCAIQIASQLRTTHRHVLLILDDLTMFAHAAAQLGTPPLNAPHVLAATLGAAGVVDKSNQETALSVALVLDLSPEDELPPVIKQLWHGVEPALDVCLKFDGGVAAKGIFPAISVDQFRAGSFPPVYQTPLFKLLRTQLINKLSLCYDLENKHELSKQLGLHEEIDEVQDLVSMRVARALFAHATERSPQELAVLLTAALVYHFWQPPSRIAVERFQSAVTSMVCTLYPDIWVELSSIDTLSEAEAINTIRKLGEVLLSHRFDFELTRPEFCKI